MNEADTLRIIEAEILGDNAEVKRRFLNHFNKELNDFIRAISEAYDRWRLFDVDLRNDEGRAHISSMIFSVINNHIISMKLLVSGYIIAAGTAERLVLEYIAMAFLSSQPRLEYLKRYMDEKYSTKNAVRDVLREHKKLGLDKEALDILRTSRNFFHKYNHPTLLTMALQTSMSTKGKIYIGASFDEGKLEYYKKEVRSRLSLASTFCNFIDSICMNLNRPSQH